MAQKAKKDRAKSNAAALNNLHIGSLIVNAAFLLLGYWLKSRSLFWYLLLSIPAFLCQFTLERTGRPSYDASGALRSSGEDLGAAGLTDYMFDVVWVTWATVCLVILFGNKLWFLWLVIPAFGTYKGFNMFGAAKQMANMQGMDSVAAAGAGNRKQRRAAA